MTDHLFIESRAPFDSQDTAQYLDLAVGMCQAGHPVTFFLVQNGVLPARPGGRSEALSQAASAGVEVLADAFSLRERGIDASSLAAGVTASPLESVVDRLAAGSKALWH